jgi:putative pyruvate formate lyase activating enzyme
MNNLYCKLESCNICPHECNVNRYLFSDGICRTGAELRIASYGPHYGEEPELVGISGSGTIFFSGCNLLCAFCQNYDISHQLYGFEISKHRLADIMIELQDRGCLNINLVTPTHFTIQIIETLHLALSTGLRIPVVWNSNAYEKTETLKLLEGLVDIYMPDIKFFKNGTSYRYTTSPDYFENASKAVLEMHRQVGDLIIKNSRAKRGLLIRHLIMPGMKDDSFKIIDFIADKLGTDSYLNLMEQYHPSYKALDYPEIDRRITLKEYNDCVEYAKKKGFYRPENIYSHF